MSSSYLVRGGVVLTLGARTQNHAEADVLIEDGVITEIGQGLRARTAETIDASHAIIMPGFVDGHRRCRMSLFKNDGTLSAVDDPSPDVVYAGTLVSLLAAAEAGVTTVVDWYDGPAGGDHLDAALRAHAESGMRTVFVMAPNHDPVETWRDTVARHGMMPSPTTSLAAGIRSIHGRGADDSKALWAAARDAGLRVHVIAGPSERDSFTGPSRDLLGANVTVAHCCGLSDSDLDALASSGAGVILTPTSDMTDGPGAPAVQAFLDRGIRPGLGVDNDLLGPGDILAQMRAAISVQHATYFDLKLAGKGGLPNLLTTRDVIKYGTIDGARAIGLGEVTGSIEVGKAADLIVLRTDKPNIHPVNDPIGAVVWGVDTSNLDVVLVGGQPLMRDGVLTSDTGRIRTLVNDARGRVGATAGSPPPEKTGWGDT
ncbi:MAG TPA: amidohydrolase family protein [Acidimicrobiia bacterium]|nr:amidohydrolase family protein [Acidimicrobiia bacterium]